MLFRLLCAILRADSSHTLIGCANRCEARLEPRAPLRAPGFFVTWRECREPCESPAEPTFWRS